MHEKECSLNVISVYWRRNKLSISLMKAYITETLKEKGVSVKAVEEPLAEQQYKEVENGLLHVSLAAEIKSKIRAMMLTNWTIDKSAIVVEG